MTCSALPKRPTRESSPVASLELRASGMGEARFRLNRDFGLELDGSISDAEVAGQELSGVAK